MAKHFIENIPFRAWIVLLSLLLCSCSRVTLPMQDPAASNAAGGRPSYRNLDHWAAHPWKKDASDSVPDAFAGSPRDSVADVFFIHPTTYTDRSLPLGWNGPVDNGALNRRTDRTTILYQASVFNQHCRVFAPRYRQANLDAFYREEPEAAQSLDTAYADVRAAFLEYLETYNGGRPIVIAAHSQGTLHAGRLLREFFEGKALQQQLVCAYIVGLPVYSDYFQQLLPCRDSSGTGCFVSWRSFKRRYTPAYVKKEAQNVYVTNPLTWTLEDVKAPRKRNKGGVLWDFSKVRPRLAGAQVHGNILWVSKPRFFGNLFLRMKNYHIADYNLFYGNIRENLETRLRAYFKKGNP
ncbi:DUF3089 domain-containing protein [Paraflavisolibacter sp. H34]|uniref:DUF3089 domain-containing protein n=1 Tax=Huijunlia imazamoxiresistens TaxID=3127457 RepID=UPI00301AD08D